MQLAGSVGAANKSIDPSARKERGPQDDRAVFLATKRDIFHYVYAVLVHPEYRERYAASFSRELNGEWPGYPPPPSPPNLWNQGVSAKSPLKSAA